MQKRYKLPLHIRNYVKRELYDYKKNIKKLEEFQKYPTSSRTLVIIALRLERINAVLNRLSKEEIEIIDVIFFKQHNQVYAEMHYSITKDMYYNKMNKMLYLTAEELELI